jgi:hypothetical protein
VPQRETEEGLLRGAAEALRPIVRRLLASGVPFGRLEARLRELFVEVAERDFAIAGRAQTDSRLALVTGINRKEVRRLRSREGGRPAPSSFSRNQAASLLSRWKIDPRASDGHGRPRPIPYKAARGASFVALAEQVTLDLPARAILDELLRTGAVELREDEWVVPKSEAYVPKLGRAEKLAMLADDPSDLIETMLRNIFEEGDEPLLQRRVSYDNLGAKAMPRVRRRLRSAAEKFLRRVEQVLARYDRDRNPRAPAGDRQVAGIGLYYFESPGAQSERRGGGVSPRRPADEEPSE